MCTANRVITLCRYVRIFGPKTDLPKGAGASASYCVQMPLSRAPEVTVAFKQDGEFLHLDESFQMCCIIPDRTAGVVIP